MSRSGISLGVAVVCGGLALAAVSTRGAEPAGQAGQASGLKAFYRSGQTFITWRETGDPTVRYRIYRSGAPIKDLSADKRVAEVSAGTSLNLSASIDINQINVAQRRNPNYQYEIPKRTYYVIDEKAGLLSPTTGLFVYTAKKDEATADITPRRVQQFHPAPGSVVHYTVSGLKSTEAMAAGDVKVDEHGHVTIEKVPVSKAGTRLVLRR